MGALTLVPEAFTGTLYELPCDEDISESESCCAIRASLSSNVKQRNASLPKT